MKFDDIKYIKNNTVINLQTIEGITKDWSEELKLGEKANLKKRAYWGNGKGVIGLDKEGKLIYVQYLIDNKLDDDRKCGTNENVLTFVKGEFSSWEFIIGMNWKDSNNEN